MTILNNLWIKITDTQALKKTSGKLETEFYEMIYRLAYIEGISYSEPEVSYSVYSAIVLLSVFLFVCSELWYLFEVTESLDDVIDNINVTVMHMIAIYKYISMRKNKDIYRKLAKSMESPYFDISTAKRRKIVKAWSGINKNYFKLLLGLGSFTLGTWYVYPLADNVDYNLPVAMYLPFEYRNHERYPYVYCFVLLTFHYISYFVVITDLMMQTYLIHLLCQYSVLADCFENILEDCDLNFKDIHNNTVISEKFIDQYIKRLGLLVNQHKLLLRNTKDLKEVLSLPMLYQFAASSMLICFAGYQVTATVKDSLSKFLMSLLYLFYDLFELFVFCRWCDDIKTQSEKIGDAIYSSGWESGIATVPGARPRLMLIMARASKPMVISAGGLYDLSLTAFTTIVKTSYSALTVLLRVRST